LHHWNFEGISNGMIEGIIAFDSVEIWRIRIDQRVVALDEITNVTFSVALWRQRVDSPLDKLDLRGCDREENQ
jgi:hypothetical protein